MLAAMRMILPDKVTVKLPWIEGEWALDDKQRSAAWELYIELITRVAVQPLGVGEGLVQEALNSLHDLFGETRRILRAHGPEVALPKKKAMLSFGQLAVDLLNRALRPYLAKWHPALQSHEITRPAGISPDAHERAWPLIDKCRRELEATRVMVVQYADLLAAACGIPGLHSH
jgi:hypothetical protein